MGQRVHEFLKLYVLVMQFSRSHTICLSSYSSLEMNANEPHRHSLQPVMKIKQHTYYILRGVDVLFIKTYGYGPADHQIRTKSRY
jgi:hypothetical protein